MRRGLVAAVVVLLGATPAVANDRTMCAEQGGEEAVAACSRWIAVNPRDAAAFYWRGIEYAEAGQHDLAIADYSSAIEIDSRYVEPLMSRAFSYDTTGRREAAAADLRRAIGLAPGDPKVRAALKRLGISP